ncbi:dihydrodipicolinate synthase family protein [Sphingomonas sp. CL5.1]|uniref:dihydrodipicolinate synthase family protein n=1 Tax=Sphingomonas sp. CL5.1 TaxID=2653203 RepID=UPI0015838C98|nr:dihydrodipicolinate synthase family protein [Sphingomonas sp. CL5.1]QKR99932.1 dihydrodipicolinate synthase family protein [Sphingomonas sp. CL5.1]
MSDRSLRGVIAAISTPVDERGEPDIERLLAHARYLLDHGCNGLNLLGTTGEATSFSLRQRLSVMKAVADAGLPLARFMVGTGAASVTDAVALTTAAATVGFAGALILPPFYYKPVTNEGIARYIGAIADATAQHDIPLYLYNFPALSGITYTPDLVSLLVATFGHRIAGLKDSSGDLSYARTIAGLSSTLDVFPSNEGVLIEARGGAFAGCISATANLNSVDCGRAFQDGDETALARAVAIRAIFDGLPLVPGIKHVIASRLGDPAWRNTIAPLMSLPPDEAAIVQERLAAIEPVSA